MRFSRLRRAAAGVRVCFPFKAEHYFTMWTRLALSHSATDGRWGRAHFVATGNAAAKREHTRICLSAASLRLGLYTGVDLMNHLVVLFLIF